MINRIESSECG